MNVAANISVLFREIPLLERFAAARAAGFDGVEMQFPYEASAVDLARAQRDSRLPTALINGPVTHEHPAGIAGRPEMRQLFREQLSLIGEYARALQVTQVHLLAGRLSENDEAAECWATYEANLRLAADFLAPLGIRVLIEPLNAVDAPNYLLADFDDAARVIEHCDGRVGLQFDIYHAACLGFDPAAALRRCLPLVRHVQFADAPGRHEPGSGRIAFRPVLEILRAARYSGWISAEYAPAGATREGLSWLADWRADILRHPA